MYRKIQDHRAMVGPDPGTNPAVVDANITGNPDVVERNKEQGHPGPPGGLDAKPLPDVEQFKTPPDAPEEPGQCRGD